MKHLIILNGCAGEGEAIKHEKEIKEAFEGLNAEIHYSAAPGEATAFLRERLKTEERPLRVYACGGDGTVYECVNGIVDYPDVELAIFAIGTGNDFVKIYGGREKFLDLKNRIQSNDKDLTNKEKYLVGVLEIALEMCERGYKFINFDLRKSQANKFTCDYENKALIPLPCFPYWVYLM